MAARKFLLADPARPEGPDNAHTRARIEDAAIALMAEGEKLNHDAVAERARTSRRTVYRYFPDQAALRAGIWQRLSPVQSVPDTLEKLLGGYAMRFVKFDAHADAMTVALSSAEGRAVRNVKTPERTAAYRAMLADVTAHLPEPRRTLAIAAIQFTSSGFAWREMRDQWGLAGDDIAAACRWMTEALLRDLAEGGGPVRAE